jgi:hypothetical protein
MYALVGHVSIDPARIVEAEKQLSEMVLPAVSGAKGFVSGTWAHSDALGKGVSIANFETEGDARAFLEGMQSRPMPDGSPVTIESMEIYRVAATA